MNLKKLATKITILSILATMTAMPLASFANETDNHQTNGNPFMEKVKVDPQTRILDLAAEYTPDSVETWVSLFESKESIKETISSLKNEIKPILEANRENNKEEANANKEAFIDDLWGQVENEEISEEEAATIFESKKNEHLEIRQEKKANRQALLEERESNKEANKAERVATRALLKAAIDNDSSDEIISALDTLLTLGLESQEKGYARIQILEDKLAELTDL